jgi:SHS2 domain-containing protein
MVDQPEIEGFIEVEHTADWAYRVWSNSLSGLFVQAAKGLYQLAGMQLASDERQPRQVELQAIDGESLLVAWLNELLNLRESENLGCDEIEILKLEPTILQARVNAAPVQQWLKDIKAATYHNIAIETTAAGWEVTVVLDV